MLSPKSLRFPFSTGNAFPRRCRCPAILVLMLASLSLASMTAIAAEEQWLKYRTSHDTLNSVADGLRPPFEPVDEVPRGLELPELKGKRFFILKWPTPMTSEGFLYAAVDCPEDKSKRDLLYFDTDCDGSLADENPFEHPCNTFISQFGMVKLTFPGDDGPATYHISADFYKPKGMQQFYLRAACWYEGKVSVGGQKRRLVLVDNNCNGCFCDSSCDLLQCDFLKIGTGDELEKRYLGKYLLLDGAYYHPEPSPDGASIRLVPLDRVPLGKVRVPREIASFSLAGESGHVVFDPSAETNDVPAGRWTLNDWKANRKDGKGRTWTLEGEFMPDMEPIQVDAEKLSQLSIGEPVSISLSIYATPAGLYFSESLKGQLGERVTLACKNRDTPAPKLRIKNKDGTYERILHFESG